MKSLNPALQAHLDEGTTTLAWCWRITRADGVTFGFTDHDRTLAFDGTELTANGRPVPDTEIQKEIVRGANVVDIDLKTK